MADKRLCAGTFADSSETIYAAPSAAGSYVVIKAVTLCNKTSSSRLVTLKFDGIEVVCNHTILGYDTVTIPFIDQIIEADELIAGNADADNAVNYYISGKEMQ